jgi:Rrf2 family nitric oxide-sensitive transcriptional repressor
MKVTQFTDFSLRLLLYLAQAGDRVVTVREIAEFHDISAEHLKKVVRSLADLGHVKTVRGKHGGLLLARKPAEINIGRLVRDSENLAILPCFEHSDECQLKTCRLRTVMDTALEAFLAVLDKQTLADMA